MKRLLFLSLAMVFLLIGCQNTDVKSWEKNGVKVKVVEPLSTISNANFSWADPGSFEMSDPNLYIVSGKISNAQEVEIQYTQEQDGEEITDFITIFDFKVDNTLYDQNSVSGTLKVSTIISSRFYVLDMEKNAFSNGKEYILFLNKLDDDNVFKKSDCADYSVLIPPVFMISPDAAENQIELAFNAFTSELNKDSVVENAKETASKSFKDFKEFLKDYISAKYHS